MDNVRKKVLDYMKQHHMTDPGDTVIAGVSGGADSVCLLLLLKSLENELGIRVHAVHVNHGLRMEAGEDEAYVKRLCAEYQVPLTVKHVDVNAYAQKAGLGCEEAGRKLRYEVFAEAGVAVRGREGTELSGTKYDTHVKIAVAHHMDDRAETVLFHLLRGTGLLGLSGIRPVRENVIRPLLCLTRVQIEEWLFGKNISYCMDSTNLEDTYTRNKIRHNILPYAESEICNRSVEHIAAAADICLETEEYLEGQTREIYDKCVINRKPLLDVPCVCLSVPVFQAAAPLLQKRLLLTIMEELTPYRKDITAVHIEAMRELFYRNGNGGISLPYELTARREYDTVVIEKRRAQAEEGFGREIAVKQFQNSAERTDFLPQQIELPDGRVLVFEILNCPDGENPENENIPQKTYTKWFDYDKIKGCIAVRTRKTGDYLTVKRMAQQTPEEQADKSKSGGLAKKTLKKYLIEEKIPRQERERILLLTEGQHVLWVIGHRISEYYKVSKDTTHILQVQLRGERADG